MKKNVLAAAVIGFLVIVAFVSWRLLMSSREANMRKNLAGAWVGGSDSWTVAPDGNFVNVGTNTRTGKITTNEGTLEVKDGFLITTVARTSRTNSHMPYSSHSRIVRVDARELVTIEGDEGNVTNVWRKATP